MDAGPYDSFRAGYLFKERARKDAIRFAIKNGLSNAHNNIADAFRHCVWSCLMARYISQDEALKIGYNHEEAGDRIHNQSFEEKMMDLANNAIGRECALENNNLTCEYRCLKRANNGELFVLE